MRRYWIFTKKELIEQWKNFKGIALGCIVLIFAMLSPVAAKLMPEIFQSIDVGVQFEIPEPTFVDAYAQFFKNMNQIVMILIVFLFSGNIAQEINQGTVLMMFSKGLSRSAFVLAKFTAQWVVWSLCYWIAVGVFWGYTQYLFPDQAPMNFWMAMAALWLLISFLLALINFASVLANQSYITMILAGGVMVALYIAGTFPIMVDYLPTTLGNVNMALITGSASNNDVWGTMAVTVGVSIVFLLAAALVFQKKEI